MKESFLAISEKIPKKLKKINFPKYLILIEKINNISYNREEKKIILTHNINDEFIIESIDVNLSDNFEIIYEAL